MGSFEQRQQQAVDRAVEDEVREMRRGAPPTPATEAELPPEVLEEGDLAPEGPPGEPYVDIPDILAAPRVMLSGEAGTGKTYLSRAIQRQWPGTVLASTTGIAAVNLGEGTTINGLLGYYDTASLRDSYLQGSLTSRLMKLAMAGTKRILIDEVSMMDGDQLTILTDALNEMNGEGYVLDEATAKRLEAKDLDPISLILVGDFAQLPPVKAPFAFESAHWPIYARAVHKLTEIRRQADGDFIRAIQAARRGDAEQACAYFGPRMEAQSDPNFDGTTILATNDAVARFNHLRLMQLPGQTYTFGRRTWGTQRGDWKNIPEKFDLKIGALVMLLSNLRYPGCDGQPGRIKYANGDLGVVEYIDYVRARVGVKLHRNGRTEEIEWVLRQNKIPLEVGRRKQLRAEGNEHLITEKEEVIGTIDYLPIRVAYATTVHKSQGLSLDRVQVDIREGFFKSPSMVYVALSRARTMEGLRLVGNVGYLRGRCTVNAKVQPWL